MTWNVWINREFPASESSLFWDNQLIVCDITTPKRTSFPWSGSKFILLSPVIFRAAIQNEKAPTDPKILTYLIPLLQFASSLWTACETCLDPLFRTKNLGFTTEPAAQNVPSPFLWNRPPGDARCDGRAPQVEVGPTDEKCHCLQQNFICATWTLIMKRYRVYSALESHV